MEPFYAAGPKPGNETLLVLGVVYCLLRPLCFTHSEPVRSGRLYVLSLVSLAAGPDVEFDYLPFLKASVVFADDVGVVNEHIVTTIARNEAEALFAIEKLDSSSH